MPPNRITAILNNEKGITANRRSGSELFSKTDAILDELLGQNFWAWWGNPE
jgi:hypothetical protein